MTTYTDAELKQMLIEHLNWLRGEPHAKRSNLTLLEIAAAVAQSRAKDIAP